MENIRQTGRLVLLQKYGVDSSLNFLEILLHTRNQTFLIFSVSIQNIYSIPQPPNIASIAYILSDKLVSVSQKQ